MMAYQNMSVGGDALGMHKLGNVLQPQRSTFISSHLNKRDGKLGALGDEDPYAHTEQSKDSLRL